MIRWIWLGAMIAVLGCEDQRNPGDGGGGDQCGAVVCGAGARCCDHCTNTCVPAESGAFCPDDADPAHSCGTGITWTSCAEAHGGASVGDVCTFTDSCGNCCCEGTTTCLDGRIGLSLCDCACFPSDGGL